jgi:hypothetical protein
MWLPCHQCLTHPQVADGGDSIQTWWVAVNILNKSQTADRASPSSFGVGGWLTTPHHKKQYLMQNI